jgi:hypothetical protein
MRPGVAFRDTGQSVGFIKDIQPAARIVQRLKRENEQIMGQWQ